MKDRLIDWCKTRRAELVNAMTAEVRRQVPEKYAYFAGEVAAFTKVLNWLEMDQDLPLEPPLEWDPQ